MKLLYRKCGTNNLIVSGMAFLIFLNILISSHSATAETTTTILAGNQVTEVRNMVTGDILYVFITGDSDIYLDFSIQDPNGHLYRVSQITSVSKEPYTLAIAANIDGSWKVVLKSKYLSLSQSVTYDVFVLPFGQFNTQVDNINQAQIHIDEIQNDSLMKGLNNIRTQLEDISDSQNWSDRQLITEMDIINNAQNQSTSQNIGQLKKSMDSADSQLDSKYAEKIDNQNKNLTTVTNILYSTLFFTIILLLLIAVVFFRFSNKIKGLNNKLISSQTVEQPMNIANTSSPTLPSPQQVPTMIPSTSSLPHTQGPVGEFCEKCKKPLASENNYCPSCGTPRPVPKNERGISSKITYVTCPKCKGTEQVTDSTRPIEITCQNCKARLRLETRIIPPS